MLISTIISPSFQPRSESRPLDSLQDLIVGEAALAKHKNKRFYKAKVTQVERNRLLEVDFDDGSYSEDLLPEDIAVSRGRGGTRGM